jgi:UDP-N-acetylglucosamine 2-epimerase
MGTNRVVGTDAGIIINAAKEIFSRSAGEQTRIPPFWDGKTAARICNALLEANAL